MDANDYNEEVKRLKNRLIGAIVVKLGDGIFEFPKIWPTSNIRTCLNVWHIVKVTRKGIFLSYRPKNLVKFEKMPIDDLAYILEILEKENVG